MALSCRVNVSHGARGGELREVILSQHNKEINAGHMGTEFFRLSDMKLKTF